MKQRNNHDKYSVPCTQYSLGMNPCRLPVYSERIPAVSAGAYRKREIGSYLHVHAVHRLGLGSGLLRWWDGFMASFLR